MNPWLNLNGKTYSLTELGQVLKKDSLTPFECETLNFCIEWMQEKEGFTIQTSGSTGKPKKISVTRNELKASAQLTIKYLNLQRGSTALICVDTRYIAGIMMLVRALESGMNMYIVEPSSNPLQQIPTDVTIDFTALVPYQLESILHSGEKYRLNNLKIALIGGAPINEKIKDELTEYTSACYATYGMTETLSHIALQKLNGPDKQEYFQVLPGIKVNVDTRGCLEIQAPHLSATAIVTNDLVEMISANQFRWLGRIDQVINSGGIKVIPEKIESVIYPLLIDMKLTNRFFITGIPDGSLGEVVTLIIEGESLDKIQEQDLLHRMKARLSRFEIPKSIRYVSQFLQTETGKINKLKTVEVVLKAS